MKWATCTPICRVMAYEQHHAAGLRHSSNSNTVMYREVAEVENLTNSDVEAMAAVYGE